LAIFSPRRLLLRGFSQARVAFRRLFWGEILSGETKFKREWHPSEYARKNKAATRPVLLRDCAEENRATERI
jgi:hypothetical protein